MKQKQSKNPRHTFKGLLLALFAVVSFGFMTNSYSQGILIKGTITDSAGNPVPGATVVIKSTPTVGTQSDFDGKLFP